MIIKITNCNFLYYKQICIYCMKILLYKYIFIFSLFIWSSGKDEEKVRPVEDINQPTEVTVRYEVSITHPDLYNLSLSYNDGLVTESPTVHARH